MRKEKFLGLEIIGWKNVVRSLEKLQQDRLKISGIHGRMGRAKREAAGFKVRSYLLDSNIVDLQELLKKAPEVSYILLHSVSLDETKNKEKVLNNRHLPRTIMVENHVHKGAMKQALEHTLSLRENGINAGIMIDIVHYFYENSIPPEKMSDGWKDMLSTVRKTIKDAKTADFNTPIGIHLPVGTNEVDSLLLDHVTNGQWKALADIIHNEANVPTVLENQQKDVGLFFLTPEAALVQKGRNEKVFELLVTNNVILL